MVAWGLVQLLLLCRSGARVSHAHSRAPAKHRPARPCHCNYSPNKPQVVSQSPPQATCKAQPQWLPSTTFGVWHIPPGKCVASPNPCPTSLQICFYLLLCDCMHDSKLEAHGILKRFRLPVLAGLLKRLHSHSSYHACQKCHQPVRATGECVSCLCCIQLALPWW